MSDVLTLEQAEALAQVTLAAIDEEKSSFPGLWPDLGARDPFAADRERVASDLAGLHEHTGTDGWRSYTTPREYAACAGHAWEATRDREDDGPEWPCPDARRYSDGLRRTAALYGVTS